MARDNLAVIFPEPEQVDLVTRERPTPGAGEVVVETERTLISTGTELTVYGATYPDDSHWDEYGTYPFEPGYCHVGIARETGTDLDIDRGQRVVSRGPHAQYVTFPATDCVSVPDGVTPDQAAFHTIAAIVMNGVRRSRLAWGETVAIFGQGLLGQFAVRLAHLAGARPVVAFDIASGRLAYTPTQDGVVAANPTDTDPGATVREAGGGRLADVTVEATGNPSTIVNELDTLRRQGRFVLLSSPRGETAFDFHDHCNWPSYEIVGAHDDSHPTVATPANPWTVQRNTELFFRYLRDGDLPVTELISHRYDPEEAPAVYDRLLADRSDHLGVIFEW